MSVLEYVTELLQALVVLIQVYRSQSSALHRGRDGESPCTPRHSRHLHAWPSGACSLLAVTMHCFHLHTHCADDRPPDSSFQPKLKGGVAKYGGQGFRGLSSGTGTGSNQGQASQPPSAAFGTRGAALNSKGADKESAHEDLTDISGTGIPAPASHKALMELQYCTKFSTPRALITLTAIYWSLSC